MGSKESIGGKVQQQCSYFDAPAIEAQQEAVQNDLNSKMKNNTFMKSENVIQVQSGSYGFGSTKMVAGGPPSNFVKKPLLNKKSDVTVSQSPGSLREVLGAKSNDNVLFGTF